MLPDVRSKAALSVCMSGSSQVPQPEAGAVVRTTVPGSTHERFFHARTHTPMTSVRPQRSPTGMNPRNSLVHMEKVGSRETRSLFQHHQHTVRKDFGTQICADLAKALALDYSLAVEGDLP